jgi:hypothetical protein
MTVTTRVEFNHIPAIINAAPQVSQEALEDVGEFVRQWAYNRCAVKGGTSGDGYYVSQWEPKNPGRAGEVRESIRKVSQPGLVKIGSNHMIAFNLEFGTATGPPTSVTAKPFMRPAVDENREEIKSRFGEQFGTKIRVVRG